MPVGVTTKKKTKPITIGETNLPRRIPNLNHNILSGVNTLEFSSPKIKKIHDNINDHNIKLWSLVNG